MEGAAQVGGKGNVMHRVSDSHQCLCLAIFSGSRNNEHGKHYYNPLFVRCLNQWSLKEGTRGIVRDGRLGIPCVLIVFKNLNFPGVGYIIVTADSEHGRVGSGTGFGKGRIK